MVIEVELALYTVNCARHSDVLLGGMGSKDRDVHYSVLACQEMGKDCKAKGYNLDSVYEDISHGLDVGLFLAEKDPNWVLKEKKTFQPPESKTGRGAAIAIFRPARNRAFEVWVASIHCKSGQASKSVAQREAHELLDYLLGLATGSGQPKAIIVSGDFNWAKVDKWYEEYRTKTKYYHGEYHLGEDKLSGKSLMQTIIFYDPHSIVYEDGKASIEMKDLALTAEYHTILGTRIQFKVPVG